MIVQRRKRNNESQRQRLNMLSAGSVKEPKRSTSRPIRTADSGYQRQSTFSFADSLNHSVLQPITHVNIEFEPHSSRNKENEQREIPKYRTIQMREQVLRSRSRSKQPSFLVRRRQLEMGLLDESTPRTDHSSSQASNQQRFFHQFESIFPKKLASSQRLPRSPQKFKPYHEEEQRCRFKLKIMQIPNIGKYVASSELDELYEKCCRMDLPEAQWQLKMVEIVRKRLQR